MKDVLERFPKMSTSKADAVEGLGFRVSGFIVLGLV